MRDAMLLLTLPSPPLGERDQNNFCAGEGAYDGGHASMRNKD